MKTDLKFAREVLAAQPFSELMGTRVVSFEAHDTRLEVDVTERLLQQHGLVHGGVISYLVDNAVTFAAGCSLGADIVTSAITVDYLRAAVGPTLSARAWVVSHSSSQAVMWCEVTQVLRDDGVLCAIGTGRANVRSRSNRS